MKESKIQKKIIDHIIKDGGDACKITAPSRRGVADILALINGDIYLFEVKVDDKSKRSVLQSAFIEKWGANGKAFFADGFDEFLIVYNIIKAWNPDNNQNFFLRNVINSILGKRNGTVKGLLNESVEKPIAKWFREKKGKK